MDVGVGRRRVRWGRGRRGVTADRVGALVNVQVLVEF